MKGISTLALMLLVTACGKDEDKKEDTDPFEGVYAVSSRTFNDQGCDAEGPAKEAESPHFQLSLEPGQGGNVLVYYACTSADSCDTDVLTADWFFETKIDDLWTGVPTAAVADAGEGECTVALTANNATLAGDVITLEKRQSRGKAPKPAETACLDIGKEGGSITTYAIEHKAQLACERLDVLRASRI